MSLVRYKDRKFESTRKIDRLKICLCDYEYDALLNDSYG